MTHLELATPHQYEIALGRLKKPHSVQMSLEFIPPIHSKHSNLSCLCGYGLIAPPIWRVWLKLGHRLSPIFVSSSKPLELG